MAAAPWHPLCDHEDRGSMSALQGASTRGDALRNPLNLRLEGGEEIGSELALGQCGQL